MRILIVSDTHGDFRTLRKVVDAHQEADIIVHCGDGVRDIDRIQDIYPEKKIINVRGNCDLGENQVSLIEIFMVQGKKIMVTHGHLFEVKYGLNRIIYEAKETNCDVVLFGHTHNAVADYDEGLFILNPGSCNGYNASFGYVDITKDGIVTNILKASTCDSF